MRVFALALLALITLSSCMNRHALREETADRLAGPVWMIPRHIDAGSFTLAAYERIHDRGATANLYIEGDGEVENDWKVVADDPTPRNPVALHLATRDKADNVIYLGRPCQYLKDSEAVENCDSGLWTERRFSKEVLDGYHAALNDIKRRWNITAFNVTGFGGGGAIAALLAAERQDILTLRTVAGNLDHVAFTNYHQAPPLESLNPAAYAQKLRDVPQAHYFGGADEYIPPSVAHSYLQALGSTNCVNYEFIQESTHYQGWVEKWPEWLADKPACRGPSAPVEFDYIAEPIRVTRETGKGQKP